MDDLADDEQVKLMKLRRADACIDCRADLPAGTEAYWMAAERVVRCLLCHRRSSAANETAPAAAPADEAGRSAQQEYEKRSARELAAKQQRVAQDVEWRTAITQARPVLGRMAAAVTPKPRITPESQATQAWRVGAEGERRVAEVLAEVPGVEVLHDRRVPGRRANIDHIAVGPAGVFVIDAKKYTGRIEARDVGGLLRVDQRLFVAGCDRTDKVDGVIHQVQVVRAALGDDFAAVRVRGVLCFIGCEWGWIKRVQQVKGVTALWPTALPGHVAAGAKTTIRVGDVACRLRERLPAASS